MSLKSTIRFKLLATILLITLLPVAVSSYLQYVKAQNAVYDLTKSDLQYMTALKAKELMPFTQSENPSEADKTKITQILNDVAESYYKPNGMQGYAFIVNLQGITIFHPKSDVVGKDYSQESFIQQMIAEKTGVIEYEFQGLMKLTAFESLPNGWILAVGSYREDLLQPIDNSKTTVLLISIVSSLAALLVGTYIVHRLLKPMKRLVEAMKQAETGDLRQEVPVTSKDELGQLSAMFNEMMTIFRSMIKEVHQVAQQVAASSEELSASASESSRASEQISIAAARDRLRFR